MTLSIGDANDVQTVARWVAALKSWDYGGLPKDDPWHPDEPELARALARLTSRAYDRLGAGIPGPALTCTESVAFMLAQTDEGHRGAR